MMQRVLLETINVYNKREKDSLNFVWYSPVFSTVAYFGLNICKAIKMIL